jgi:4'-phosphopantetheinyl transferase
MPARLRFVEALPEAAAARLDAHSIHLWRIPYALPLRRSPFLALLAAYLGVPVRDVVLDQNPRGKPRLADAVSDHGHRLEFNWSHSGDCALIALARDCALGVDVERLGKKLRVVEIARRFFDPVEAEALALLDDDMRDEAFIGLWCAKEAVLKSTGQGLSFGLARLAFTQSAATDWKLARVDPVLGRVDEWQLVNFTAAPGYRGGLAWHGGEREIMALQPSGTFAS